MKEINKRWWNTPKQAIGVSHPHTWAWSYATSSPISLKLVGTIALGEGYLMGAMAFTRGKWLPSIQAWHGASRRNKYPDLLLCSCLQFPADLSLWLESTGSNHFPDWIWRDKWEISNSGSQASGELEDIQVTHVPTTAFVCGFTSLQHLSPPFSGNRSCFIMWNYLAPDFVVLYPPWWQGWNDIKAWPMLTPYVPNHLGRWYLVWETRGVFVPETVSLLSLLVSFLLSVHSSIDGEERSCLFSRVN